MVTKASHRIDPERRTLHGHFSRDLAPVLTVEAGDRVHVRTLDAGWGMFENPDPFAPPTKFTPLDKRLDSGHPICGPIAVRGAEPGRTLVVHIEEVHPGTWGWTSAGGYVSPINRALGIAEGPEHVLRWAIDADAGVARDANGRIVKLRPFMGVLGMPPAEAGIHSTIPPRATGGNIDCRELIAGSTLYLPIAVAGGLFSVGDGHGLQGDGEVSGVAIECPMERVTLRFEIDDTSLALPRAETPAGRIAFGFHEDLNRAAIAALDNMLSWIGEAHGLGRKEALALCSLLLDLRITQMVNGVQGVHALLPRDALGTLTPTAV
jgi:acetamidase/formamidase